MPAKADTENLSANLLEHQIKLVEKLSKELLSSHDRAYTQIESLLSLRDALRLSYSLPALRGWAASPDLLLMVHEHVRTARPRLVVECGSGASTLVIADALRQNGFGQLVSLEHDASYADKTRGYLVRENLDLWAAVQTVPLVVWEQEHFGGELLAEGEKARWYDLTGLQGLEAIDLLFVDGPPAATCPYSRYPAIPAFFSRLSCTAEVWMDDTRRQQEKQICEAWAQTFDLDLELRSLDKGLGILRRRSH